MFSKRSIFNCFVTLALIAGLGACQSPPATTTAAPPDTPRPGEPISTSTSTSTPTQSEPTEWVSPENWWLKPQVWAQRPDSYQDLDGNFILNMDYGAYSKAGLTVMNWFDAGEAAIQGLHDRGIIVAGDDSMIATYRPILSPWSEAWRSGGSPPKFADAAIRDPFGNIFTDNMGLDESFVMYSMNHPEWQDYKLERMKAYIDAGVDGYLIDELAYGSIFYPDFNPYTMQLFNAYLLETYSEEQLAAMGDS
jgi:hypothetical protein